MTNRLTAVGVGPGDPELITIKGRRAIEAADVVFVPRSRNGEHSIALHIADRWIDRSRQPVVELALPMTRNSDELVPAWQTAADRIAAHLTALGDRAAGVYLLLGDPLLYGTFTYIWRQIERRHPDVEIAIVPGVTSFSAAAALGQMPLGSTSDRIAILPATYETDAAALQRLLADFEVVVLMKVGPVLPCILAALDDLALLDAALYAERIGMRGEYVSREVRSLRGQTRPYLSLLIVTT